MGRKQTKEKVKKDMSENTSVSDENTLVSTEERESECETPESNICLSTNDFSFPSEFDSSLQDLKEFYPQEDQDGEKLQSEFIYCDLEESKNEDSRTNLFEEGGDDMILEASNSTPIYFKFINPSQGMEGLKSGAPRIKTPANQIQGAYRIVWDTRD